MAEGTQVIINLLAWLAGGILPALLIYWIDSIQEKKEHEREKRVRRDQNGQQMAVSHMRKASLDNRRHLRMSSDTPKY